MDLQEEIHALDRRVFQLWGTLTVITLTLTAGLAAVLLPEILKARGNGQPISQLISGLLILVVLLNVYLWKQRRYLVKTREAVSRERTRREMAEAMAVLDPLTDSFNRRYMETVVAKEVSRADRLGSSLVFVMVDVDDFKAVNTRFGHVVGDQVLRDVAEILKQSCRLSDTIVRYGGDEFLILLSGSTEVDADRVVARIQERADAWNKVGAIAGYAMGLSCGFARYTRGARVNEIIEQADQQMYEWKTKRRAAAASV
jgi:diguanylate cyclase (GGDEF)-like protein